MLDSAISWLTLQAGYAFGFGEPYPRGDHHPNLTPFGVYECQDGPMVVAAATRTLWESFREAVDRPALARDPHFESLGDRVENRDVLVEAINDVLDERAVDDWTERLHDNEVPAAPIYDIRTVWEDEHVEQRELHRMLPREEQPDADVIASPIRFTNGVTVLRSAPSEPGSDTEVVLENCGWTSDEIDRIRGN